jgi:predicted molibdopterin-dependent oxidoreductase YjgC
VADPGERAEVEAVWGPLPAEPGRGARAILEAAARRELDVLFLVGVDPLRDHPDAALARRALQNVRVKVLVDARLDPALEPFVDCVLPAAPFLEKEGHYTDWEGRGQRIRPVRDPIGLARPDWEIFAGLAVACGEDLGFETLDELRAEAGPLLAPRPAPRLGDPGPVERPARGDGLVLFTYPLLVDEGRLVDDAQELKGALGDEAFLEVHPEDAARLGLGDGRAARVRTAAGAAELPVRVSDGVAPGAAFVPFTAPGFAANVLLSGAFRTDATVEPIGGEEPAAAAEDAAAGGGG